MSWVTHEVLILGQLLGACAYTAASYRLWRCRLSRFTAVLLAAAVALDVTLAVLGSTSNLGNNSAGSPWRHPLFAIAAVLATLGMLGYIVDLVIMLVRSWRTTCSAFLRYSQCVIWPSWISGVAIFILNVYLGWF